MFKLCLKNPYNKMLKSLFDIFISPQKRHLFTCKTNNKNLAAFFIF